MVSKPSKATSARGQSKARTQSRAESSGAGTKAPGGARRKSTSSRTKAELEDELAELKQINDELRDQLRREQERANRLAQINQQAGQRIESVIGRIKTLLAS